MAKTMCYKILEAHLLEGKLEKGESIVVKIDQSLTQDATGTMAYLQFEALGLDRVKNELAVSYVDHNTVQVGFENFDDHEYLRTVAKDKGVIFSRAGNGICHQVHLERFALPGKTLIGSDSHTPTAGGVGSFSMGAGGLDVALAMAGVGFSIIAPRVVNIILKGKLRPFVSAKDIILKVLERYGVKGNVNTVFEYTGDGVKTLTVPERATITNMGAECGVTTSLFPSDEVTKAFLDAQNREGWIELKADEGAEYDDVFEIDLSVLEPMAACPHSPGNVKSVSELKGMKINQVLIGSCTNSSYLDLKKAAEILDGHVIPPTVSLGVAPGSRAVMRMIAADGTLDKLVAAGARILESACGFCIGNHQSPGTDGVSLRTNNRNFEGRSGTKSGQVYLVSPETAAYSALKGYFADPTECDKDLSGITNPDSFLIDDTMFIFPDDEKCEIKRGPNIGAPPTNEALRNSLSGEALLKVGDKITTDHIMPAGQYLKYRSNIPLYSTVVFNPVDPDFAKRASEHRDNGEAGFIIAGASYGQGSSREHAAICPMYLGIKAVVAVSIERIHQANLCNFGILPLLFENEEDYEKISQGDELRIDNVHSSLKEGKFILMNLSKGWDIPLKLFASDIQKEQLYYGGRLNQIKECGR
ncbi:MAG: aconitate hydratase [Spirochaetales bacterium]|nr:aconitate hydratase [Spirochaetales bacterium]